MAGGSVKKGRRPGRRCGNADASDKERRIKLTEASAITRQVYALWDRDDDDRLTPEELGASGTKAFSRIEVEKKVLARSDEVLPASASDMPPGYIAGFSAGSVGAAAGIALVLVSVFVPGLGLLALIGLGVLALSGLTLALLGDGLRQREIAHVARGA